MITIGANLVLKCEGSPNVEEILINGPTQPAPSQPGIKCEKGAFTAIR